MVIKAQDVFRVCDGCVFMKPHSLKHSSQRVDISCAVPFMANTKDAPLVCKKRSMWCVYSPPSALQWYALRHEPNINLYVISCCGPASVQSGLMLEVQLMLVRWHSLTPCSNLQPRAVSRPTWKLIDMLFSHFFMANTFHVSFCLCPSVQVSWGAAHPSPWYCVSKSFINTHFAMPLGYMIQPVSTTSWHLLANTSLWWMNANEGISLRNTTSIYSHTRYSRKQPQKMPQV